MTLKKLWAGVKSAYGKFEDWVHSWMPGWKTFIVSAFGTIGSTAAVCQQYITQLPLDKFITANEVAAATLIISLLALWFHGMGERVEDRS